MPDESPPVAKGNALVRTDEELDALARVRPGDLVAARTLWTRTAPGKLRGLLDASAPEEDRKDGESAARP